MSELQKNPNCTPGEIVTNKITEALQEENVNWENIYKVHLLTLKGCHDSNRNLI